MHHHHHHYHKQHCTGVTHQASILGATVVHPRPPAQQRRPLQRVWSGAGLVSLKLPYDLLLQDVYVSGESVRETTCERTRWTYT